MQNTISGKFGEQIAKVIFNEPETNFRTVRWASEFSIDIPIKIYFRTLPNNFDHGKPYLNMIWGNVYAVDRTHNSHQVGTIAQIDFREPFREGLSHETKLVWRGQIGSLALLEKLRDGEIPKISLSLWAALSTELICLK
jgi:hypothetical protein